MTDPKNLYDYAGGGLLCDEAIKALIKIEPFADKSPPGVISYGLTSYGYDMRVGYKFKVFTNCYGAVVDPKGIHASAFVDIDLTPEEHAWSRPDAAESHQYWHCHKCDRTGHWDIPPVSKELPCKIKPDHVIVPPNSFALAGSVEKFTIPRNMLAVCLGKSTLARCGIIVNVTPLEPEWTGHVTVEISNTTPLPCKIYANEGISQVLFFAAPVVCRVSYADKKGVYQDQTGLTLPTVRKG